MTPYYKPVLDPYIKVTGDSKSVSKFLQSVSSNREIRKNWFKDYGETYP